MGDRLLQRIAVLVDEIESKMRRQHEPDFEGLRGRIVLDVTPMNTADVRRAARIAGERVGWRISTHLGRSQLLVVDRREPAHEITPWLNEMFRLSEHQSLR